MNFQKLLNEKCEKYIEEKLPESVEKHLDAMIDDILKDFFRSYWDGAKAIKDALSEKIKIDVTKLSLIDYNWMIATALQNKFESLALENCVDPIMQMLSETVGEKYKDESVNIEKIFEKVSELNQSDKEYSDEGKISFFTEYNKKYKWITVYCDEESDQRKDECSIKFIFSVWDKKDTIFSIDFLDYKWVNSYPIDIIRMSQLEKFIHTLFVSKTEILFDEAAIEAIDWESWDLEMFDLDFYIDYD